MSEHSVYAELLNALDEMQQSPAYAVRWPILAKAERAIVRLEQEETRLCQQLAERERERDEAVSNMATDHDLLVNDLMRQRAQLQQQLHTQREELAQVTAERDDLVHNLSLCKGNELAAEVDTLKQDHARLRGIVVRVIADLEDRYDGAPDSPIKWLSLPLRDLQAALADRRTA